MAFELPEGSKHRDVLVVESSHGICKTDLLENEYGTLTVTLPFHMLKDMLEDYANGNAGKVTVKPFSHSEREGL